jgi:RimJ/RimL family protein N-acetyltransferase
MSARVTLEPITLRHAERVQQLASDPAIVARTSLPDPYPEDGAERWIERLRTRRDEGKEYAFAVLNAEGTLVGVTGLDAVDAERAELGYWVGRPYWNRGYATAAARKTLRVAFERLEVDRVSAHTHTQNAASRRVLEKLGFERTPGQAIDHPKWDEEEVVRFELSRMG